MLMARLTRRGRLGILLAAVLIPFAGLVATPVQADEPAPIPTVVRLFHSAGQGARTIGISARVRSDAGVPTGTITFYLNDYPDPVEDPIQVSSTGLAKIIVGVGEDDVYRAVFHGTAGYADSEGTEGDGLPLRFVPHPTILQLGGPSVLKLNLTTSVSAFYSDGIPAEGSWVEFTYGGSADSPPGTKITPVCYTDTDMDGLAKCGGSGGTAAILSLLGTGTYANVLPPNYHPPISVVKLPVIVVG